MTPRWLRLPARGRPWCRAAPAAFVAGVALLLSLPAPADSEIPLPHDDLPDWLPSVGIGGGFLTRDVKADFSGRLNHTGSALPVGRIPCVDGQGFQGQVCTYMDSANKPVDGFVMPVSAQLLGPSWKGVPGRPRLLLHGGRVFTFQDRLLVSDGFLPVDFDSNGLEPDIWVGLREEQQDAWWVGGGVGLQLPFDSYPTWIKFSLNFFEEDTLVEAIISEVTQLPDNITIFNPGIVTTSSASETLTTRSFAPAVGVEAIVGELGPFGIAFAADVFVPVALSGTRVDLAVRQRGLPSNGVPPIATPMPYSYRAERIGFLANVMLRFVWMGR